MEKKDFQKGAISVFLVIILIPCIVISGMFVDISRVKLSQGVATSAADLALNSLMANYDKDLSDYYGMMASCQNIEDFYEESAQFFLEALYSQGLSADDAESLMTYTYNLFTENQVVHDLFQMEVQTDIKDIVSAYKGGNSTEASLGTSSVIIKDQIVEFMKYRAPVEISSKIIERLTQCNAAKVLGDADKDEDLVDDKKEYAEAEEDFMDAAYKTYKALKKYEDKKFTVKKLKDMLTDMKNARETYREIVKLLVSNFNGTSGLTQFKRPTYKINLYSYTEKSKKVYSRKEKDASKKYVYYIDGSKITKLLDDLEDDITDFKNKRKDVSDAAGDKLVNASIGTGSSQYHPIQWWKKVNSLINNGSNSPIEKFKTSARKMLDSYAKVLAIKKCKLGEKIPTGWESRYNELTQAVKDLQTNFLKSGVGETGGNINNMYLRLVNKLEKHSKENINKINPSKVKLKSGKTVQKALSDVSKTLSTHISTLDDVIEKLNTLIDGGGALRNNPYSLSSLAKKADDYHTAYKTWKSSAQNSTTEMGKEDRKTISQQEANNKILTTNKQEILDFKTRLVNIRTRLKDVKDTINSMKFGKKKLVDIKDTNTLYNAVKNDIGENLKNSDISSKADYLFKNKFTPYSANKDAEVKKYNFSEGKYNPELKENSPKFYNWLKSDQRFASKDEEKLDAEIKKKKELKENKKNEDKTKSDSAKNKNRWNNASKTNLYNNTASYAKADFPSGLDANGQFSLLGGVIEELLKVVPDLVNGNFLEDSRDALYSTEYVMDMFSYSTYENEGKYALYKKENNKAPSSTAAYSSVEEKWKSKEITDKYNQTLTNKKINAEHNVLMNAEAEYVLYGLENSTNIKKVYGNIFAVRYALNLVSGFQYFWSDPTLTGITSALSAATCGVVPEPAIKCVAIIILTALETGSDLNRLQDGFPVELYKGKDDWRYAITGEDLSPKSSSKENKDLGLFYSDYLYLFLYLGFKNENSASEMYRRTADLMQVNMRKNLGKNDYKLKNSKSYFQINAKIRVKPLMLALPISQGFSNNPKDKNDWCTFEIHEIRGYS